MHHLILLQHGLYSQHAQSAYKLNYWQCNMNVHFRNWTRQSNHYWGRLFSHFLLLSPPFRVHSLFHSTSLSALFSCLQSCFHTTDFKVCAKLKCNASCRAPRDYLAEHLKYILQFLQAGGGMQQFKQLFFSIFILYLNHTLEIYIHSLNGWMSSQLHTQLGMS